VNIGFYPGCSLEGSSREYAESLRAISPHLGLELEELEGWNCCGSSSAHQLDHTVSLTLPARILGQAELQHLTSMLVPCAACFNRLAAAKKELAENAATRGKVSEMLQMSLTGAIDVQNILEVLSNALTPAVQKSLPGSFPHRVVCYYGCLLVRPASIVRSDRIEDPKQMDDLMKQIGAIPLPWGMKTECCGASLSVTRTDIVGKLCGTIIEDAVLRGAEAIIVACPMCHSNLDMRRKEIERVSGKRFTIPVLYVTQAIGLAMGIDAKTLGLHRHFVKVQLQGTMNVKEQEPALSSPAAVVP
jgi:heterodisulfide reductase subunit B2